MALRRSATHHFAQSSLAGSHSKVAEFVNSNNYQDTRTMLTTGKGISQQSISLPTVFWYIPGLRRVITPGFLSLYFDT
jgi:hypothetical protein